MVRFGPDEVDFPDDDWKLRADGNTLYVENKNTGDTYQFVNNPSSGDDVARMGDVSSTVDHTGGVGPMSLPFHMTEYAQGLSNAEIGRVSLEAGKQLEVWRLETRFRGGGTSPDFTVDVYDADTASVIASTSSRVTGGSSPAGTSSTGATVLLRVSNATAGQQVASISGILNVEEV